MCGVHFMAETAKLMSPDKKVLLPDMKAGCSLSSSINGEDVRYLDGINTKLTPNCEISIVPAVAGGFK